MIVLPAVVPIPPDNRPGHQGFSCRSTIVSIHRKAAGDHKSPEDSPGNDCCLVSSRVCWDAVTEYNSTSGGEKSSHNL